MKILNKVTPHYGYYAVITENGETFYVVCRIRNNKVKYGVSAFRTKELAVHECNYLEKLNFSKEREENE